MKKSNYVQTINEKLRVLREMKLLTQFDMAEILGINRNTYCQYENGNRRISVENLCRIADEFELPLDWFAGRDVENNKKLRQ